MRKKAAPEAPPEEQAPAEEPTDAVPTDEAETAPPPADVDPEGEFDREAARVAEQIDAATETPASPPRPTRPALPPRPGAPRPAPSVASPASSAPAPAPKPAAPAPVAPRPAAAGRIANPASVFSPIEHDNYHVKVILYGSPGVGKTTLAATAPNPVFLDLEKSTLVLAGRGIQRLECGSITTLREGLEALRQLSRQDDRPFDTVVVDTITEMQALGLVERLEATATDPNDPQELYDVQLQDYGFNSQQQRQLLREIRALPMHVVYIAQEATDSNPMATWRVFPALSNKAVIDAMAAVDAVFRLTMKQEGDVETRVLHTRQHAGAMAKDRSGTLPAKIENPDLGLIFSRMLHQQ